MNKFAVAIIILVVIAFGAFFFGLPKYQEYLDGKDSLRKKQSEYEIKSAYYSKILALDKEIQSRSEVLDKVNSALPEDNSYAELMYLLQTKGSESGLTVKSITFSPAGATAYGQTSPKNPAPTTTGIKKIFFTMSISGTYQDLKNFLASLDNSLRLFQVNSIAFNASAPAVASKIKTKSETYSVSLEAQTYTY